MEIFGMNIWFWVAVVVALLGLWAVARYAPKKPIAKSKKKK
ncbi:MAG: hypothetical protein WC437_03215 [Patescibacteria group bacterium]